MVQGYDSLNRNTKQRSVKKQYFFIFEGEKTEPNYFEGIRRHKKDLNITDLVQLNEIPKYSINWSETNILNMIDISESYIKSIKNQKYHIHYFTNILFEKICLDERKKLEEKYENVTYYEDNHFGEDFQKFLEKMRKIRDTVINTSKNNNWIDSEGFVINNETVKTFFEILMENKQYNFTPGDYNFEDISEYEAFDGDDVCIIHDRDFHPKYFPNTAYDQSLSKIQKLSNDSINFRLFITYPKFEFWLSMHSEKLDEKLKTFNISKYPNAGNNCDQLYWNLYPKLRNKKVIDTANFDIYFANNIKKAIEKSQKYPTDLKKLRDVPGTNMGLLLAEMMNIN